MPDNASVEDVMLRSPRSAAGKSLEATEEISNIAAQLIEKKATAAEDAAAVEELADKLKLYMGDAEVLTYQGRIIATWKSNKDKVQFDGKKFIADHPDMVKSYMKTAPGDRRFLLK